MTRLHSAAACAVGSGQTVGLVTSDIVTFDLSTPGYCGALDNVPFDVELLLIGMTTANVAGKARITRGFKRIAGALSALAAQELLTAGANGALLGEVGIVTALASLVNAGNLVKGQATGIVGLTINWTGYLWVNSGDF